MFGLERKQSMPSPADALPGRDTPMPVPAKHYVLGTPMEPEETESLRFALFGLGCFWGVERRYWQLDGVYTTAVGYAGGLTPNPTYAEVCSGMTGHNEVVRVAYEPAKVSYRELLQVFCVAFSGRLQSLNIIVDHECTEEIWENLRRVKDMHVDVYRNIRHAVAGSFSYLRFFKK